MIPELRKNHDVRVRESALSSTGALVAYSGHGTGRSPKDKRVVLDETTKDKVWWGNVNMPITPHGYEVNRARAIDYLNTRSQVFVIDGFASWDPNNRFTVRVVWNRPYHALFMKQMLIRPSSAKIDAAFKKGADFTIINGGKFPADLNNDSVKGETCVSVNLKKGEMVILGTQYAGEIKKGLFGVMHYYMPNRGILSMHASANEGKKGDISILFGLSRTGKTTLSADPQSTTRRRRTLLDRHRHLQNRGRMLRKVHRPDRRERARDLPRYQVRLGAREHYVCQGRPEDGGIHERADLRKHEVRISVGVHSLSKDSIYRKTSKEHLLSCLWCLFFILIYL